MKAVCISHVMLCASCMDSTDNDAFCYLAKPYRNQSCQRWVSTASLPAILATGERGLSRLSAYKAMPRLQSFVGIAASDPVSIGLPTWVPSVMLQPIVLESLWRVLTDSQSREYFAGQTYHECLDRFLDFTQQATQGRIDGHRISRLVPYFIMIGKHADHEIMTKHQAQHVDCMASQSAVTILVACFVLSYGDLELGANHFQVGIAHDILMQRSAPAVKGMHCVQ